MRVSQISDLQPDFLQVVDWRRRNCKLRQLQMQLKASSRWHGSIGTVAVRIHQAQPPVRPLLQYADSRTPFVQITVQVSQVNSSRQRLAQPIVCKYPDLSQERLFGQRGLTAILSAHLHMLIPRYKSQNTLIVAQHHLLAYHYVARHAAPHQCHQGSRQQHHWPHLPHWPPHGRCARLARCQDTSIRWTFHTSALLSA